MTLSDYIIKYREEHGLSQRQFAAQCGLSNGYISILERGSNPNTKRPLVPSIAALMGIAHGTGVTLNELFETIDDMPVSLAGTRGPINQQIPDDLYDYKNVLPMPSTSTIPLIGSIPCGEPRIAIEEADETVELPEMVQADFALRCSGDSMINARIYDGDIVYIRSQPTVDNGEIAAVLIDDEATLKKFYHYPDRIVLEPANPMYDPLVFRGEEMQDVRVLGKAVAFTSLVR